MLNHIRFTFDGSIVTIGDSNTNTGTALNIERGEMLLVVELDQ